MKQSAAPTETQGIAVGQIWRAPDGRLLRVVGVESGKPVAVRNVETNRLNYQPLSYFDSAQKWHLVLQPTRLKAAALSSPSVADNRTWLPIETAPKDGTHVLVFDEGLMIVSVWVEGLDGKSGWYDCGMIDPPPTHWMPLPNPPSAPSPPTAAQQETPSQKETR